MLPTRHEGYGIPPYAATQATIHPFMATFSSEELARQVLAMFTQDHAGKAGRLLNRQDLLAQWPKGFTHVELTTALEYAMSKGRLEQTEQGMKITPAGLAETKF